MARRPSAYPPPGQGGRVRPAARGGARTSGSTSASLSSAAGPPDWPARSGSASCWRTTRPRPSGWARRRSRCSTRAAWSARTCSPARSSTRPRCATCCPARTLDALPGCFGPVRKEAVYLMTRAARAAASRRRRRSTTRATWIFSLRQLGRHLAERAEELGAMVLPETDAQQLLVSDGAVRGVRTGDKGLGRDGRAAGRASSPASRCTRRRPCSRRARRAT